MVRLGARLALLLALALASSAGGRDAKRFDRDGISLDYPSAWFLTVAPLSNAINPRYRFAVGTSPVRRTGRDSGPCLPGIASQLRGDSALAYLREALGSDRVRSLPRMQPRPRSFRLPARGDTSLCGFGSGGRWIPFKEAGRAFYLGLYLTPDAPARTRRALARVIDGMEIRRR